MDTENLDKTDSSTSQDIEHGEFIKSYKLGHVSSLPKENNPLPDDDMDIDNTSANSVNVPQSTHVPSIHSDSSHGLISLPDYVPQSIRSLPKISPYTAYIVSAQFYEDLFSMEQLELVPIGQSYVQMIAPRIKDFGSDAQSVLTLVARKLNAVEHHLVHNHKHFQNSGLMDHAMGKSVTKQRFDFLPQFAITQLLDRLLWANKPGGYSRPNTKSYLHPDLGLDDAALIKMKNAQEFFTWTDSRMDGAIRHFDGLCGGLQQKVTWKPNAAEDISQTKEILDDLRLVDSEVFNQPVAGSSNIVSIGHNTSIKNAATLRQSQYANHIHGIVSSFQHGSITDVHLVFSNLWHIATSAFVLFNFDNSNYLKALQTALFKMEMHEKVAQHVLEYLQESITSPHKAVAPILTALAFSPVFALEPGLSVRNKRHSMRDYTSFKILTHSFKQPISTKDSYLIAECAIWCCVTDMLASLNAMARVNLSNTYSQAVSFQLDQPWFLQLIQSLTDPALLTANSLIQWQSKSPWPCLHKVYPELASVASDDSGLNARDDEDITDVIHPSKEKQSGDRSGKGATEGNAVNANNQIKGGKAGKAVRDTSGNGGGKGKGKAVAGKRKRVGNNKKKKDASDIEEEEEEEKEEEEEEEDREEEEDTLEERPMKQARIENGHLVIVKREPETLHMTDSYRFVDFIDLTHEIDEELPHLPITATPQDLSRKVKWLKLQRVMQCDDGSLTTEKMLFKVPFPWECKQDMEIIGLLFPKVKRLIEPVAKATSPDVTSPESPLSNLSELSKESSLEEEEPTARTELNFYRAKCRPAALSNMDKLGRDGLPIGHIFPSSIKDRLTKSGVSHEEKDKIRKLTADRPIQWVPDTKFNDLKTAEEYEDFELDIQDLRGGLARNALGDKIEYKIVLKHYLTYLTKGSPISISICLARPLALPARVQ
ncbi:hypothetical protein M422DRAFT_273129 [Sphaerobolus stellatus SS14]|uniref:Uncharacterized protein n=1 Tax=Sphaerobolus stellatus (strain SS14) TaxID=990650 RepID=A0A0C9U9U6_SPHS4|nr:hypothetical protein M422DRAFT_273129 [Sphaerobolus stellatus SS14]